MFNTKPGVTGTPVTIRVDDHRVYAIAVYDDRVGVPMGYAKDAWFDSGDLVFRFETKAIRLGQMVEMQLRSGDWHMVHGIDIEPITRLKDILGRDALVTITCTLSIPQETADQERSPVRRELAKRVVIEGALT